MAKANKVVLVTGATGRQGGAVARHLLAKGWKVRALTRNVSSDASKRLADLGAELVSGDYDDSASLQKAMRGCYGVFSVQNFWEVGAEREIEQGKNLASLAHESRIKHFVYASVGAANRKTGLPHFESKSEIEKHIQRLGLPATVVRPVAFMENYYMPYVYNKLLKGKLVDAVRPDVTLQLIAVDDIGAFTAYVFDNPKEMVGQALEIAGDQLTTLEIAALFGKVMRRPVQYKRLPALMVRPTLGKKVAKVCKWLNDYGFVADIEDLRARFSKIGWTTFEEWLTREGWSQKTRRLNNSEEARARQIDRQMNLS